MRCGERLSLKRWPFQQLPRVSPVLAIYFSKTLAHRNFVHIGRLTSCGAIMESDYFFHGGGIDEKPSARTARGEGMVASRSGRQTRSLTADRERHRDGEIRSQPAAGLQG